MSRVRMLAWVLLLIAQVGFLVSGPAFFGFIPVFGIGDRALAFDLDQRSQGCINAREPIDACTAVIQAVHAMPRQIAWGLVSRGRVYIGLHQPGNALRDFTEALEHDPDNATAWYQRAGVHGREGRYVPSIADYNESIKRAPDNPRAHFGRGLSLMYTGHADEALLDYDEAIRLDPSYGEAFLCRGDVWYRKGDRDQALRDYDTAIRLHPHYRIEAPGRATARAVLEHAGALGIFGQIILAAVGPSQSPRPHKGYAFAFTVRGRAAALRGQYARALLDFEEAVRLDLDLIDARINLGHAQIMLRRFRAALETYDAVIARQPDHALARGGRRSALANLRQTISAIAAFDEAPCPSPGHIDAMLQPDLAHVGGNGLIRALADFEEVSRHAPGDSRVFVGPGDAWSGKGACERAIQDHDRAPRRGTDATNRPPVGKQDGGNSETRSLPYPGAIA